MSKLGESVAAGHDRSVLYGQAMRAVRNLAAGDNGEVPTGARMEALRLADWLLQVLVNTTEPIKVTKDIIEAMMKAVHRENFDKQERYALACEYIGISGESYRTAKTQEMRNYSAVVLASQLFGLDRKFSAYMILSAAVPERTKGNDHLAEMLAKWAPSTVKAKVGQHHTAGLLAVLCLETGAFGTKKLKVGTPAYRVAKRRLTADIGKNQKKIGSKRS